MGEYDELKIIREGGIESMWKSGGSVKINEKGTFLSMR